MTDSFLAGDANLQFASRLWATESGGSSHEDDGILICHCPFDLRGFNQIFVRDSNVTAETLLAAIAQYGDSKYRVRFTTSLRDALTPVLEATGLAHMYGNPSMALTQALEPAEPASELRIVRVVDEQTRLDHAAVVAETFKWTAKEAAAGIFTPRLIRHPDFQAYVGYANGAPVASVQLMVHGNVAGLYYVGTLESARRKGYADAITRHAVIEGVARGCEITTLQASPTGKPVYERLGFTVVGEYLTYAPANA